MYRFCALLLTYAGVGILASSTPALSVQARDPYTSQDEGTLHKRSYFYVGGAYVGAGGGQVHHGQIYVEKLTPANVTQSYPLLFIHGNGQTGTNWLSGPGGNLGWADYFMSQGFQVYIMDQYARGRSPWYESIDGPMGNLSTELVQQRFTAPELYNLWPQAKLHTQWPGNGTVGDPYFDECYNAMVQSLASTAAIELATQASAKQLMETIGKSIVITHSQAGGLGWILADSSPSLVAHLIALEPSGPPFQDAIFSNTTERPYGITAAPLAYSPALANGSASISKVGTTQVYDPATGAAWTCFQQAEGSVRSLTRLSQVNVSVWTTPASYHSVYDECTVNYLRQAGVPTKWIRLAEDEGIHGNGHVLFLEKNQQQLAQLLLQRMRDDGIAH